MNISMETRGHWLLYQTHGCRCPVLIRGGFIFLQTMELDIQNTRLAFPFSEYNTIFTVILQRYNMTCTWS